MDTGAGDEGSIKQPFPIFRELKGDRVTVAFACGKCGQLFTTLSFPENAREMALDCCYRRCACGALTGGNSWTACEPCRKRRWTEHDAEMDRKRRAKVKRVPLSEYEGAGFFWEDEYYQTLDYLYDHCDYGEVSPPKEVWGSKSELLSMDVEDILESALEDHHEEAYDRISEAEKDELQRYLDTWCKETGVVSYSPDYGTLVLLEDVVDEQADDSG